MVVVAISRLQTSQVEIENYQNKKKSFLFPPVSPEIENYHKSSIFPFTSDFCLTIDLKIAPQEPQIRPRSRFAESRTHNHHVSADCGVSGGLNLPSSPSMAALRRYCFPSASIRRETWPEEPNSSPTALTFFDFVNLTRQLIPSIVISHTRVDVCDCFFQF